MWLFLVELFSKVFFNRFQAFNFFFSVLGCKTLNFLESNPLPDIETLSFQLSFLFQWFFFETVCVYLPALDKVPDVIESLIIIVFEKMLSVPYSSEEGWLVQIY